jgi:hypothetical protein
MDTMDFIDIAQASFMSTNITDFVVNNKASLTQNTHHPSPEIKHTPKFYSDDDVLNMINELTETELFDLIQSDNDFKQAFYQVIG